jgi:hypothetical protein
MYEDLDCFEKALAHFGTRTDIIIALEMGDKIDSETAYQKIKMELKELKRVRKTWKENRECGDDC